MQATFYQNTIQVATILYEQCVPAIVQDTTQRLRLEISSTLEGIYGSGNEDYLKSKRIYVANNPYQLIKDQLFYGLIALAGYGLYRLNLLRISIFVMGLPLFFAIGALTQFYQGNHLEKVSYKVYPNLEELPRFSYLKKWGNLILSGLPSQDLTKGVDKKGQTIFLAYYQQGSRGQDKPGPSQPKVQSKLTIFYFGNEYIKPSRGWDEALKVHLDVKTYMEAREVENLLALSKRTRGVTN
jgi:hypothetical protein